MKEQIEQAISEGRTEDALTLLAASSNDAVLLQARFNQGKKQYNMGLIEFSEWSRVQAQINYAALEMAGKVKSSAAQKTGPTFSSTRTSANDTSIELSPAQVFISYNHQDSIFMQGARGFLESRGIRVFVDVADMNAGDDIQVFIDKAFKENHFVLSIISRNSLLSGWVNKELSAVLLLNRLQTSRWLPVRLDDACFNPDFYNEAMDFIDEKIQQSKVRMRDALDKDRDTAPFEEDRKRLLDLKANLGTTLEALRKVLVIDISGQQFEPGMNKVLTAIQNSNTR